MPVTVNIQDNPLVANVGKTPANSTIIYSGYTTGYVEYEVRRKDQNEIYPGMSSITLSTQSSAATFSDVLTLASDRMEIVLPFRTNFQARVRRSGGAWETWTNFKTRDKNYRTPDAITELTDNRDSTCTTKGNRRITITNSAKAAEVTTIRGTTVTNTDNGYIGTTNIAYTSRGATVTTDSF